MERRNFVFSIQALLFSFLGIKSICSKFNPKQVVHFKIGDERKAFYPYGVSLIEPPKQEELCLRSGTDKYYFRNEQLYLIESKNGDKHWYKDGVLHREDGPAVEYMYEKRWYKNGKLHRDDGPAIEYRCGDKFWFSNGTFHREDGPAIEYASGTKFYYLNGIRQ